MSPLLSTNLSFGGAKKSSTSKNKKKRKALKKSNTKKQAKKRTTRKVKNMDITVVFVYANWCPHCTSMKPEWQHVKDELSKRVNMIEIEDSDADKDIQIMNIENNKMNGTPLEIMGYPTLLKIENGSPDYYTGDRVASSMSNWINNKHINKFMGGYKKGSTKRKSIKRKSISK